MSAKGQILLIDDERPILLTVGSLLERHGYAVATAANGASGSALMESGKPDLVLLDLGLPDMEGLDLLKEFKKRAPLLPVIVLSGQDSLSNAIDSIKLGAFHFIGKPYVPEELLSLVSLALEQSRLARETVDLRAKTEVLTARLEKAERQLTPVFKSRRMAEIGEFVSKIAPSEANILITGESGVGKEVLANMVHERSNRASGPIVKLNCAAFPEAMIEGELFGYVKGAFTGAVQDFPGMIEAATGGTLFLDEIAEMPVELQTRFLRVLQEREFRNLGSTKNRQANFRLIAATNRDVKDAVVQGRLRQDLYYRLNTFQIEVPPLRERREDVPALAKLFAERFAGQNGSEAPRISPEAMRVLAAHEWPGNVRELENAMEYAVILAGNEVILPTHLPADVVSADASLGPARFKGESQGRFGPDLNLEKLEKAAMEEALIRTSGNKKAAAALLGLHRPTFYNKLRLYGIDFQFGA